MTYAEWYQTYIQIYKRNLKPKTVESYDRLLGLMSPILGDVALASITPELLQMAINQVEDAAGSRQAQLAFALLRASLARAVRSRRLTSNPVDAIDKPAHHGEPGRAIKGHDWQLLRPLIAEDVAFALAAFAGLRRGEVLALTRADVDLQRGVIHVRRQLVRVRGQLIEQTPKSAAGHRDVPITPELAPVLQTACRLLHPRARLVQISPETLNHRWRRLQLEAGVAQPYRLHDLRHTCATRLIAAGCSLNVVQYVLGHSSYQLTADTYTHIDGGDAAAAVKKIASLMR